MKKTAEGNADGEFLDERHRQQTTNGFKIAFDDWLLPDQGYFIKWLET